MRSSLPYVHPNVYKTHKEKYMNGLESPTPRFFNHRDV